MKLKPTLGIVSSVDVIDCGNELAAERTRCLCMRRIPLVALVNERALSTCCRPGWLSDAAGVWNVHVPVSISNFMSK